MYTLPDPINKVTSMKVTSIEFPNSWYTISSENNSNVFTITIYNCPTPIDITGHYGPVLINKIEIPPGNYRSDFLSTAVNNVFSNMRNGLEFLYFDVNELNARSVFRTKLVGDDTRNLYTSDLLPPQFHFTVDFTNQDHPTLPIYKNVGWMFGFKHMKYEVNYNDITPKIVYSVDQFNTKVYNWFLESESSYGNTIHNYVFLEIDDFNRNSTANTFFAKTDNDAYLSNGIMARISVPTGMFTIITMDTGSLMFKSRDYFGPVRLEKLRIRLIDKHGHPINLEGNDFSFMLEIDQIYSK